MGCKDKDILAVGKPPLQCSEWLCLVFNGLNDDILNSDEGKKIVLN